MSASKDKGTKAETAVVGYLQGNGWPDVERRTSHGARDRGDIAGLPVVVEVKSENRLALAEYVDEANREGANAGGLPAVVWHKRKGTTDPGRWYVTCDGATFLRLLGQQDQQQHNHDDHHDHTRTDIHQV